MMQIFALKQHLLHTFETQHTYAANITTHSEAMGKTRCPDAYLSHQENQHVW